jgi:hypothetical protein
MAVPLLELEGTWEEIKERLPDLAGQKLRIVVFPAAKRAVDETDARPIDELLAGIAAEIPPEELAKLPPDFTDQLDHYTYGTPKG